MNAIVNIWYNFEFIRPWLLWALIPVLVVYILSVLYAKEQNLWQQIIPQHLYQQMVISKGIKQTNRFVHIVFVGMLLATLAIAGPSWEKLPQAVYQTQSGKIILLDMSMSMRATDLSPDRLTRARFKALDLVEQINEGETGVVAYAGDAFVVSPLTDDISNLQTLIPVLSPDIMPVQGSSALAGLERSAQLLVSAGYQSGQIYWITDGIRNNEIKEVREFILSSPFDISALLVGTETGAPVQLADGQLLKDRNGKIVVPSINSRYMSQAMSGTSAEYQLFTSDDSDLKAIERTIAIEQQQKAQEVEATSGDTQKDMGPYLTLLLLPIVAYSFRKGVFSIALVCLSCAALFGLPAPTLAQTTNNPSEAQNPPNIALADPGQMQESIIDKAFKNNDQRGQQAFDSQNYRQANALFDDPNWKAASAYKMGDYEAAAELYAQLEGIENKYNKGNALAKKGDLSQALDAYNDVLDQQPDHKQALQNKQIIEDLMEQQQQQNNESGENGDNNQNNQNQDDAQNNQQNQSDQQNDGQKSDDQQGQSQQNDDQQSQDEQSSDGQSGNEQSSDGQSGNEQNNEQQNNEPQNNASQSEPQNDQSLQDAAQQQQNEQDENRETQGEQSQTNEQNLNEQEQQSAISNQIDMDQLTPEQQEELQRMQMILNKVPDDPAYLLKRKMLLEAYKRKSAQPPPNGQNW